MHTFKILWILCAWNILHVFYRPGILKHINMKHLAMIVSLIIVFIAVSWKKISFYFITGNSDSFDQMLWKVSPVR